MQFLTWCLALAGCFAFVHTHSYHMGACPIVEPMQGFQINRVRQIIATYIEKIKLSLVLSISGN